MVTAAAPLSICHRPIEMLSDVKVEARKRRREVRASQRGGTSSSDVDVDDDDDVVVTSSNSNVVLANNKFTEANKRMKATAMTSGASIDCSCTNEPLFSLKKSTSTGKKQQMKYDPDVPMTKEEAAKWRREQRRKRNRESAAASRQRQRDRITELEVHVENWKSKFEGVMARIAHLEKLKKQKSSSSLSDADSSKNNIPLNSKRQLIGSDSDDDDNNHIHHHIHQPDVDPIVNEQTAVGMDMEISPLSSISRDSPVIIVSDAVISASSAISSSPLLDTPVPNPLSSFDITSRATPIGIVPVSGDEEEDMLLPSNMISRPAVKITEMAEFPLLPEVSPDSCVSQSMTFELPKLEPISNNIKDNNLVGSFFSRGAASPTSSVVTAMTTTEEKERMSNPPHLLSDEESDETEFGVFLLDAIDWL